MSNFVKQLGKGFVRSAVNQVGRDTGRVVSNKLYGDAHSAPIRGAGSANNNVVDVQSMTDEEYNQFCLDYRKSLEEQGYSISPTGKFTKKWTIIFWAIFGLLPLIGVLPTIIFIIRAIPSLKGYTIFYNDNVVTLIKVPDARYSTGYRVEGTTTTTDKVKVTPIEEEKIHNIHLGVVYLIAGIALAAIRILFIQVSHVDFTPLFVGFPDLLILQTPLYHLDTCLSGFLHPC